MGGTGGIGMCCAEMLAAAGWKVGVAGRNREALKRLEEKYPQNIQTEVIDVTAADAPLLTGSLIERLGGMDIYFHVSGIGYENTSLDADKELDTINTNVMGFVRCIGYAYRYFRDNNKGAGQIAAITSVAGTNGIGRAPAYSASKTCGSAYLRALTQLSAKQRLHIHITDIRPGFVDTPLLKGNKNYPMTMSVDYASRRVLRAIRLRRRVAVIDWRWNLVVGFWRLIPNWLWTRVDV